MQRGFVNMVVEKLMKATNCVAVGVAGRNANLLCYWIFHEPKEPEEVKKLRKF